MSPLLNAARRVLNPVRARVVPAMDRVRRALGLVQPEARLIRESEDYWRDPATDEQRLNSHWRGAGFYADDARWLAIGRQHLELFETFARAVGLARPLGRVVEWGCGGGANAVHFAPLATEFVGVDIAKPSLDECARQLATAGVTHFRPVLADAADPEAAAAQVGGTCDLFLCVYVFELLPSPEYAARVLRVAAGLLAPGGLAMIQIKYRTADPRTAPRRWAYRRNLANNTTYSIDEFWLAAESAGLRPRLVSLVPKDEVARDERYAYFALQRADAADRPDATRDRPV